MMTSLRFGFYLSRTIRRAMFLCCQCGLGNEQDINLKAVIERNVCVGTRAAFCLVANLMKLRTSKLKMW